MYNASDRKDVRKAEKDAEVRELARVEFIRAAMSTIQGRVWFHDILAHCHLFNDPFTGDALREAYLKGERNVGLKIFADILAHCPDQYIKMMKEATDGRLTTSERPGRADADGGDQGPVDSTAGDDD